MKDWLDVSTIEGLPEGAHKALTLKGIPLVVFNLEGDYYAIENQCTHQNVPLSEGERVDSTIACPLHGAQFCIKTGQVLSSPIFMMNVVTFPTRVENGRIQVQV